MNELISIIVPVYNTGDYLENSLKSILNQDYSHIEIILVDDGSKDKRTIELCDVYAAEHENVRVYHKPNGGSASARNYGIQRANGKFIGFIDSDDVIDPNMFSTLFSVIKRDGSRVAICGISTEDNGKVELTDEGLLSGCYNHHDLMHHFLLGHWHSACTCLYEKELFKVVEFPEGDVNEDYMLNYWIFKNLDKLSFVNTPLYHYLRREGSNTASPKTLRFLDWIKHTQQVLEEMKQDATLIKEAEYQYLYSNIILANSSLLTLNMVDSDEARQLYDIVTLNLIKNRKMLRRNPYFSSKNKLMGMVMAYMPRMYKMGILSVLKLKKQ